MALSGIAGNLGSNGRFDWSAFVALPVTLEVTDVFDWSSQLLCSHVPNKNSQVKMASFDLVKCKKVVDYGDPASLPFCEIYQSCLERGGSCKSEEAAILRACDKARAKIVPVKIEYLIERRRRQDQELLETHKDLINNRTLGDRIDASHRFVFNH